MARMHSRKKGKSRSAKPAKKQAPSWQIYKPKEIELLVVKLTKEGQKPSRIGLHLRDTYGIVDVKMITGKSITQILQERKLLPKIPEDLTSLIKKEILIRKHLEENHKDETAKRGLTLTTSKIRRLVKYYKKSEVLPLDWKYDPSKVSIFLE
ncbi:MAG: 30S ribosomal protein S15 [DPANN group archaeon]|nr:30S ribosomal protein S15 [DPANN group archaeon]